MAADYPFSGMDMLQNSLTQMVSELRNVGQQIGQSVQSLSATVSQQAAAMGNAPMAMHQMALGGGGYGVNQAMMPRANFLAETFSNDFNKPSLWSRDLMYATGLKNDPHDMTNAEAKYYASRNLGRRAGMFGLKAAQWLPSTALSFAGPVGMAAGVAWDATFGEVVETQQQKNEWSDWLDRTGRNNVLSGSSMNMVSGAGWSHSQQKNISKYMAGKDKQWWNQEYFKYDELQSMTQSADAQGYYYNTTNPEEFKRKTSELIKATREIMKTMKMTVEEAGALMGEISFAGYSSPLKTIKQINSAAAATGLSIEEVKNYGIGYGKQQWAQYGANKDASTEVALEILSKYNKKQTLGAQAEMGMVEQLLSGNHMMQWGLTKFDDSTGTLKLDNDAINKMMGMNTMQQFQYASQKFGSISPNNMPGAVMQMNAIGPALMYGMNPNDLLKVTASASLEPLKMLMKAVDPQGFESAIKAGGDDPWGWVKKLQPERQMVVADYLSKRHGAPIGAYMEMIESNSKSQTRRRGPQTMDEMDLTGEKISNGNWWNLWTIDKYEDEDYTLGKINTNRAGNIFNSTGLMDAVWADWRADPDYKRNMRALSTTLQNQRHGKIYDSNYTDWSLTRSNKTIERQAFRFIEDVGELSMGNFTAADIQTYQDDYLYNLALLQGRSSEAASNYAAMFTPVSEMSDMLIKGISSQFKTGKVTQQDINNIRNARSARNINAPDPEGKTANLGLKNARGKILKDVMRSADYISGLQAEFSGRSQEEISAMLASDAWDTKGMTLYYSHLVGLNNNTEYLNPYEAAVNQRLDKELQGMVGARSRDRNGELTAFGKQWNKISRGKAGEKDIRKFTHQTIDNLPSEERLMYTQALKNNPQYAGWVDDIPLANIATNRWMDNSGKENILGMMFQSSVPEIWQGARAQYYLGELSDKDSSMHKRAYYDPKGFAADMTKAMVAEAEAGGNKLTTAQIAEVTGTVQKLAGQVTGRDGKNAQELKEALKEISQSMSSEGDMNATMQLVNGTLAEMNEKTMVPMSKAITEASGTGYLKVVSAKNAAALASATKAENR